MAIDEVSCVLAARLLVRAYRHALSNDKVDWDEVDEAAFIAAKALGEDLGEPLPEGRQDDEEDGA